MVSFENFVKSMPPSLSELKVLPDNPDNVTATKLLTQDEHFILFNFRNICLNTTYLFFSAMKVGRETSKGFFSYLHCGLAI